MRPVILVLLAAGQSRRFGGNKLFYPVDGIPMYRRAADLALELGEAVKKRIVVTGYDRIREELEREGFTVVRNSRPDLGISRSVRLAVEAAEGTDGAICFLVCDQPWLKADTVRSFLEDWDRSGRGMGCLVWKGRPGNPAVFGERYREELKNLSGDRGGRQLMDRFPDEVFRHEASTEKELVDMDTREMRESRERKMPEGEDLL